MPRDNVTSGEYFQRCGPPTGPTGEYKPAPSHSLTKRELEILALLADELTNKQISDRLCIFPATVKRHTENIYRKLDVPDRHKAVARAMQLDILHPA